MRPIPSSALSTEILVGAGCIILRSRSADRYQRGCIVVTGLLLGLGQLIPLGDPHRILQFHTRHSSQSDYNRRISSVLPRFPSAVGISGVPLGDLKPVHRRRIPCRRNIWSTWSIARDVRSATLPVELSALFTGSILCAYFRDCCLKTSRFAAVAFEYGLLGCASLEKNGEIRERGLGSLSNRLLMHHEGWRNNEVS